MSVESSAGSVNLKEASGNRSREKDIGPIPIYEERKEEPKTPNLDLSKTFEDI